MAVALNCGMGSSSLNAEVKAFERFQIVRGRTEGGACYFFRVEIASGFAKAHGRLVLVGLTPEQGASDLRFLTPIDPSHVKDSSEVLRAEQALVAVTECAAGPVRGTQFPVAA